VIGLRFRFKVPPDEPGDPKIPLHRIVFFPPGLLVSGLGLWQAWRYFQLPAPAQGEPHGWQLRLDLSGRILEPKAVAGVCAIVFASTGAFFLLLAFLAERSLRKNNVPREDSPMFVSARQFTLLAGMVGSLYLFGFLVAPWLLRILPGPVVGLIWLVTAAVLCNGILRFFRKKPHRQKDCENPLAENCETTRHQDHPKDRSV